MRQFWSGTRFDVTDASYAALANSAALTDVTGPVPPTTLAANELYKGETLRLTAFGRFSNTATPTLLLGFYYGGVAGQALAASGAITTITGATNWPFRLEATVTVRSLGSAGSALAQGVLHLPASLTQFQAPYPIPATALSPVAIDTTGVKALTVGAQWGAASASNTLTVEQFIVEQLN